MNKRRLLSTTVIIVSIVSLMYLFLGDKITRSNNQKIQEIKTHQILNEGYTYQLEWIPGQDRLLAYIDGYIEIVDIFSGKREKIYKLNENETNSYQPLSVSPDGSRVILKENKSNIIFDLQAGIKEEIPIDEMASSFSWSSDGENIAYESNNDIFVYHLGSKKTTRLTFDNEYWYPCWALSGNIIAFRDYRTNGLYIIKADGTGKKKLIGSNVRHYLWHPNGEIWFLQRNNDENSIFAVRINNNKIYKCVNIGFPSVIDISPDGKQIVLTKQTINENANDAITDLDIEDIDIFLMNLSSKQMINLTNTPTQMEVDPKWSSDGKKVLFFRIIDIRDTNPIPVFITVRGE